MIISTKIHHHNYDCHLGHQSHLLSLAETFFFSWTSASQYPFATPPNGKRKLFAPPFAINRVSIYENCRSISIPQCHICPLEHHIVAQGDKPHYLRCTGLVFVCTSSVSGKSSSPVTTKTIELE